MWLKPNSISCTLLLLGCALAGCRTDPRAQREIALLKAEILDLEDDYYALLAANGDSSAVLPGRTATTRQPRLRLRDRMRLGMSELSIAGGYPVEESHDGTMEGEVWSNPIESGDIDAAPAWETGPDLQPGPTIEPQPQAPHSILDSGPEFLPPTGNQPEEIEPGPPSDGNTPVGRNRLQIPAQQAASSRTGPRPNEDSSEASQLEMDQKATHGIDTNQDGLHDGLQISFTLTDENGMPLKQPKQVVFSLIDPALPSGQQRLGLWEHTTVERGATGSSSGSTSAGSAPNQVILKWQKLKPQNGTLLVFARHMRSDGTALESSVQVEISTAADGSAAGPPLGSLPSESRNTRQASGTSSSAPVEFNIDVEGLEASRPPNNPRSQRAPWRAVR